jgi:UDP-N-acetylmuramate dehydrogenase
LPPAILEDVPLASLTTFELGGPARFFCRATSADDAVWALGWAHERDVPVFVVGGGSNLVVGDDGFPGLVLQFATRGMEFSTDGLLCAQAGEPWDDVVAAAVARDLAGIECLSGIPGVVGSTPIQNVGAYGQEVADTIQSVRVLDRSSLQVSERSAADCGFGYRTSAWKREQNTPIVLSVTFALRPGGRPKVLHKELAAALAQKSSPSLPEIRQTVLEVRRRKSMVYDPADPYRRSAGSFFTNPVVSREKADRIVEQSISEGLVRAAEEVLRYPQSNGDVKLAAGWLIEHAGIRRGLRMGPVGVSPHHALALIHHGGGTAKELLRLAVHVRDTVANRFGVTLVPEPVFLGVAWPTCLSFTEATVRG